MFAAARQLKKDDDDAAAKSWRADQARRGPCATALRWLLCCTLGLVLLGLIMHGVGLGTSSGWAAVLTVSTRGDDDDSVGNSAHSPPVNTQWSQTRSMNSAATVSTVQHAGTSGSSVEQAASTSRVSAPASTDAKPTRKKHKKVWVTEELEEYASLITDAVSEAWELMEADQPDPPGPFTLKQSEFYAALTLLSLNISTVCELGAADGRSAITWLEALPWTQVYSFSRPQGLDPEAAQEDGSFGAPVMETSGEPRTASRAAPSAQQAFTRQYLQQKYGKRYTWLQLNSDSTSELQRVAEEHSIGKCDVVAISADMQEPQAMSGVVATGALPSVETSAPLPRLKAGLRMMRQLTKGWHFLLVDGMGCSNQEAATAVDEATSSPKATAGGLRGPRSTSSSDARVPIGQRRRGDGSCTVDEATRQFSLAPSPQRVRATWEVCVAEGDVVEYECRTGQSNLPGWCLGTYRAAKYTHAPGGESWLDPVAAPDTAGNDESPRVLSWMSSEGMYLNVGDKLKSETDAFFLSMQEDGNLVIYRNYDDDDGATASESGSGAATAVWSSRTSGTVGNYFLTLQVGTVWVLVTTMASESNQLRFSLHSPATC